MRRFAHLLLLAVSGLTFACGESTDESAAPDLAVDKPEDEGSVDDGKFDRWDYVSDPDRFDGGLNHVLADLPRSGRAARVAWPSTYWPTYMDSVQHRWNRELSPAEKYDRAFNGWTPPENFDQLRPFNPADCSEGSWDRAYYDNLGPLARHVSTNMGNAKSRDGRDSDGDGRIDECDDHDGVATWWGLCHAWVPAAMLEERPLRSVTHNGITFHVGDLEALLILAYNRSAASILGGRCNLFQTAEEMARVYGCRLPEQTAAEGDARPECTPSQLEQYVIRRDEHGRAVQNECRDTNAGAMHVIMTNYLGLQQRAFAYDRTFDFEVWNQPVVAFEVSRMDEITAARANTLLGATGETYAFNPDAVKLYDVSASLTYITESHASTTPADASRYERKDRYTYILEVDANGEIIGGEYYGNARELHPDFLWDPRPITRSSVPHLDIESVRMLVRMSREPEAPTGGDSVITVAGGGGAIPDNDPNGMSSSVTVSSTAAVASVRLELDVTHSYIGDLRIALAHGGTEVVVHNNEGGSTANLRTTLPVNGFQGAAAGGEWTLRIVDSANLDVGSLVGWKLHVTPGAGAPAPQPSSGEYAAQGRGGDIPDNDPIGFSETVTLTGSGAASAVTVRYEIVHTYIGDLKVTLSHGDRVHTLHDRVGGGRDDISGSVVVTTFAGAPVAGEWTLKVVDAAGQDVGRVASWGIEVATGEAPPLEPETDPAAPESFPGTGGIGIPDNDGTGITSTAEVPSGTTGSAVAVAVNISHTYRGDLKVVVSRGARTWTLHDRTGGSADDLVQTVVLDPAPTGDLGGTWTLTVVDAAARDVGTLNSWSVVVTP